ncbi:multidrug resistance-associated ABC transporter [Mycena capillaripes]|nr:multidrug resistance-associated ABC transporter [Mycena capillaripes]
MTSAFSFWLESWMLPPSIGIVSLVVLLLHVLWESRTGFKFRAHYFKAVSTEPECAPESYSISGHIRKHGGITIFSFKAARLVGCLVLLTFSIVSLASEREGKGRSVFWEMNTRKSFQFAMCMTYFYAFFLAILSVAPSAKWGYTAVKHLNSLLLTTFGVYFYRDIFPLATFALVPMDVAEGQLLWIKIVILFAISGIIPLVMPRQYIPVDPKNPNNEESPEQTSSLLSLVLYFFLDPIIFLGYRLPHLKFDQLPPLCDYDYVENLKMRAWPHIDVFSGKRRHIAFGIAWTFRWTFLNMVIVLIILALSAFISPIAINRLLFHLENPDKESFMKPWFWILLLFLGPTIWSLSFQWYVFISKHIMTQTTAIITQLVFEHALRIRVKSETGHKGDGANLLGKMTNLVTTDLEHITEARNVLFLLIFVPIQIIGSIIFLYRVLGWSAFVGMGVMVALFPLPGYVSKLQQAAQKATLKNTDARVQTVSESKYSMNVLRMIKMFGWEKQMDAKIVDKREDELRNLWKRRLLDMASGMLKRYVFLPLLAPLIIECSHFTVIAHEELSVSKVFSSMGVFDLLRTQLWFTFFCISTAVNGKVSLDRLNDFLHNTELLDSFTSNETAAPTASNLVGFRDATFAWFDDETGGTATPPSRRFLLKIEGELIFKPGCVNLVLGPTGSGKTSFLMALLGEMHFMPSDLLSWYNLPRERGVSYAAQESWVMNDTIRNNILFNSPMNEERYNKVLYQCCLKRDLELWEAGDETEVGEKGLTLSGGQKARVTLARAIYADTEIILLDDVLAALDVHTAKWIVDECLSGDLIKNRTVILVTHNLVMTGKIAEFVVSLGLDGRVRSQGSISDALEEDEQLAKQVSKEQEILEAAEKDINSTLVGEELKKKDGKLMVAEEIALGHISWKALNLYFKGMGGAYAMSFFVILISTFVVIEMLTVVQAWFLGYWASQYGHGTPVAVFKYLGRYSAVLLTSLVLFALCYIYYTLGSFRASRTIHRQLVESILGTTFRWLDFTPTSRIIARCTVDISVIDSMIPEDLRALIEMTISMLTKFGAVVLFTPVFFFAGTLVGILGALCCRIYIASQLSVKREQSNAKAPVLSHFGATIAGLTSVRAYGAQEALIRVSMNRINRFSRASRTFANLNRWVTVRIDFLGALFAAALAYYVVYFQSERPYKIGFSLNMALGFANMILNWVRMLSQFEVQGNSLERIQSYLCIEQEPKPTAAGIPPAYWPASGSLSVDDLSAKYSPDGPTVLHNLSFNIKSGERVGVVGRTGSGKSSLTLSLLRCIFIDGTVYYDGLPTSSINLDALRSSITIIPQVPELLAGSLRSNLDIFGWFDDATLNSALGSAGLSSLQENLDEGKLTLDSEISAGGSNLSVGQRQVIALARAIVRGSKLMILDEATSAIDYKTEAVIQLPSDTTLLIVAHRLQTIMSADRIMVLDAGRIVEFDTPKKLLQTKHGLFRALVGESGDKEVLYKMAQV